VVTRLNPEIGTIVERRVLRQIVRTGFDDVRPQDITAAIKQLKQGIYRAWSDLCDVVQNDPVINRAYTMQRNAISGRGRTVKPSPIGEADVAKVGVDATVKMLDRVPDLESTLNDMLDALGRGAAVKEIVWVRDRGMWWPTFEPVMTRDLEWDPSGGLGIRTLTGQYLRIADHPGKFWSFIPRQRAGLATDQGSFQVVVFWWLFKKWCFKFWLIGAERFGNPMVVAKMAPGSSEETRESIIADLQALTADSVGAFTAESTIEVIEAKAAASSQVWKDLGAEVDRQMMIGLVGSPDLFEAGANGSRSAVGTRDAIRLETTEAESKALWGSFARDVLTPFLQYNADAFGGVVPPTPTIETVFEAAVDIYPTIAAANAGMKITQNELRAMTGLPPLPSPEGDEAIVPPAMLNAAQTTSGGTDAGFPFSTSPGLDARSLNHRGQRSLQTSTPFLRQLKSVLG